MKWIIGFLMVMAALGFSIYTHYAWPVDVMPQIAEVIKDDPRVLLESGEVNMTPGHIHLAHLTEYRGWYIGSLSVLIVGYLLMFLGQKK